MVIHSYKGYEIKKWEKPCPRCIRIEMPGKYRAFIIPRHYPYTIYMRITVSLLSGATFPGVERWLRSSRKGRLTVQGTNGTD